MITEKLGDPRKLIARTLAVMALLGLYFGASLGMTGLVTSPAAAQQRGNRGNRNQGQNAGRAPAQPQVQVQPQPQPRKKNKGAKIIGTINAVGAVLAPLVAPPPRAVDGPYRRRRRRRRRGDEW